MSGLSVIFSIGIGCVDLINFLLHVDLVSYILLITCGPCACVIRLRVRGLSLVFPIGIGCVPLYIADYMWTLHLIYYLSHVECGPFACVMKGQISKVNMQLQRNFTEEVFNLIRLAENPTF